MNPPSAKRPKVFTLTLSEDEHARLTMLASADDRSAAGWLRHAINSSFDERGFTLKKKSKK